MRKRIVSWAALAVCVLMLAQGCAYQDDLQFFTKDDIVQEESKTQEESAVQSETVPSENVQINVDNIYYSYHHLDADKQQLYLEILDALANMKSDAALSTVDKSGIELVFTCVMNDHPELFYVGGYQIKEYTLGNKTTDITFSGMYSMSAEEAAQASIAIEQKIAECFQEVPLNEDEYSTVKFIYEWIIENTEYDKSVENNQNIVSVFLHGKSVCQGYAKAMQYMLQKVGIECVLVTGFTNGEGHAWNLARVDGDYYYIDTTWGDVSYTNSTDEDSALSVNAESSMYEPSINYDYFLVTTDEITWTHSIEKSVELPLCLATDDNYFVREGLYFDAYDDARLAAVFGSEKAKEDGYVTIKCSSESYASIVENLINSQEIFKFIDKRGGSIAYSTNEKLRIISFWNI